MIRKNTNSPTVMPLVLTVLIIAIVFVSTYGIVLYFADDSSPVSAVEADGAASGSVLVTANSSDASGRYVFLAAGQDAVSGLTDVILLVSFDTDSGEVTVLQLPRDTYLNYTERSYKKINGASHALGGLRGLADMLETSLGVHIDYTLEFTIEAFSQLVDLIGGVPINIPYDMDYEDPSQQLYIHLKAGEHRLCGAEAVQFVRFRSGYVQGDIGRTDAQKLFLAALTRQVTEGLNGLRLPAVIGALIGQVNTDMSFGECLNLARAVLKVDMSDVVMLTLPGRDARTGVDSGAWYYIMNRAATRDVMTRRFGLADDAGFDPSRLFTNNDYPHFDSIYDAGDITYREYRADDINQNGIGIALTGG
ncbi:MAG: LCP family protein [Eubacteriales bacterium]|nr:LCP family protein [Eubacteriales bacterium]